MFPGSSSQSLRQTHTHKIERWPGFVQRRWLSESVEEHFVGVGMFEGIFEIALARLSERSGAAEGSEEFDARLDSHGSEIPSRSR